MEAVRTGAACNHPNGAMLAHPYSRHLGSRMEMSGRQDATDFTKAVNDALLTLLPFEDRQDFEDAARGHIADISGSVVHAPDGRVTWDPNKFAFVGEEQPCPPTVNPSLWRQSQLCAKGGLFKVVGHA